MPERLDDDFWSDEEVLLLAILLPLITKAAVEAAGTQGVAIAAEFALEVDWTQASADAIAWARTHAADLVTNVTATTQQAISNEIANWIDAEGATMGDLFDALRAQFGFSESRAQMIAVTEVTRAFAEGNQAAIDQLSTELGITFEAVWRTNEDELVCPVCGALANTATDEKPPAHPRCRCWKTHRPVFDD